MTRYRTAADLPERYQEQLQPAKKREQGPGGTPGAQERPRGHSGLLTASLVIPWPPSSGNHHVKHAQGRHYLTQAAKDWRLEVARAVEEQEPTCFGKARLRLTITAMPPDRRRRDLGNIEKVVSDALEEAGLFDDDSQIDDLRVIRGEPRKPPYVVVDVEAL